MKNKRWQVARGKSRDRTPNARRKSPDAFAGLTLVEVLMSLMVTGIGILGVVALLPLAFVRAVQATNLTNGTILRYNAESMIDFNQRLLLRWQPQQSYSNATASYTASEGGANGDIVLNPNFPNIGFQCTTSGTSGLLAPAWNTTVGGTTTDGTAVWTTVQIAQALPAAPVAFPPPRYVIDPLGWYTLGSPLQTTLGNNGGAIDKNAIPRFNGQVPNAVSASLQAYLPDSWVEQARSPVTSFTANTATLSNVDLSSVSFTTPAALATATPPYTISRIVLIDATGKVSQTRIITSIASPTVNWSTNDPLTGTFTPVAARVETQELRYTWLLTVMPSSGGGSSNVEVTVFFHRPLVATDEQVFQATGVDGVQTPFTISYTSTKPFVKKGAFLFDAYFGRWYRILNVTNDTGSTVQVFVDQPRPQGDVLTSKTFGAVFMRGVVDVFPLPLK
jgi:hypothetical protein